MKGDITFKILEFLSDVARSTGDILDLFLTDYHSSYRIARGLSERRSYKRKPLTDKDIEAADRHRLESLLFWLKNDGLIKKSKSNKWQLTRKGISRKSKIIERAKISLPVNQYSTTQTSNWKIISFDIPESEKRKRAWLRGVLRRLGFKILHKSVWIGKADLPEKLIKDWQRLNLLSYIEILAVTKSGSLRKFIK